MDHTEALKNEVADRYLLGELSDPERERFEEHYFECQQCAADLQAGLALSLNARAVFQEERPLPARAAEPARPGWWDRWMAAWAKPLVAATSLATCVLAVVCAWQAGVVIPQLRRQAGTVEQAAALPTFALAAITRGEPAAVIVPRQSRWFSLSFDVDPQVSYASYRCDLIDESGTSRFQLPVAAPPPGQPISVLLPVREVRPGKYKLNLQGVRGETVSPVSEFAFHLQYK
jgi:anti-sigma factor RsiW